MFVVACNHARVYLQGFRKTLSSRADGRESFPKMFRVKKATCLIRPRSLERERAEAPRGPIMAVVE